MDTAQPLAAETDPNAALQAAADAFKSAVGDKPRDEQGRFARQEIDTVDDEPEIEGEPETGDEGEIEEQAEAADEVQPEPVPMPSSWSKEEAERWNALPPETQAFIAEREGQRDAAVNSKFQEAANVRKELAEKRDGLAEQLETIMSAITPVEPDPRAFGYGTQQYNEAAYRLALQEYQTQTHTLKELQDQRNALATEQAEEERKAFMEWKQAHDAQYEPKLLADFPDIADPVKGQAMLHGLIDYAVKSGIPADIFSADAIDQVTAAQLHILAKAQEWDKAKASGKPVVKQAGPAVRPGVSSPRSASKVAAYKRASDNLKQTGSIEAGAAIFKHHLFRG